VDFAFGGFQGTSGGAGELKIVLQNTPGFFADESKLAGACQPLHSQQERNTGA
jgi:hypothetical protein